MKKKLTLYPPLELVEASTIVKFCEQKGRSPLDVLLDACGLPSREPFIFETESHVDVGDCRTWDEVQRRESIPRAVYGEQNRVYLDLLSQLLNWDNAKVSAVLEKTHGRHRLYFSREKARVSQAKQIGHGWYACTKLNAGLKQEILYKLLCRLGFTPSYSRLISDLARYKKPRIAGFRFESDDIPDDSC